jgi:hypothetical protein
VPEGPDTTPLGEFVSRWFPAFAVAFGVIVAAGFALVGASAVGVAVAFVVFTAGPLYGFYGPTFRRRQ